MMLFVSGFLGKVAGINGRQAQQTEYEYEHITKNDQD